MGGPAEGSGQGRHLHPDPVPLGHLVHPQPALSGQTGPGLGKFLPELFHLLPGLPDRRLAHAWQEPAGFEALQLEEQRSHRLDRLSLQPLVVPLEPLLLPAAAGPDVSLEARAQQLHPAGDGCPGLFEEAPEAVRLPAGARRGRGERAGRQPGWFHPLPLRVNHQDQPLLQDQIGPPEQAEKKERVLAVLQTGLIHPDPHPREGGRWRREGGQGPAAQGEPPGSPPGDLVQRGQPRLRWRGQKELAGRWGRFALFAPIRHQQSARPPRLGPATSDGAGPRRTGGQPG